MPTFDIVGDVQASCGYCGRVPLSHGQVCVSSCRFVSVVPFFVGLCRFVLVCVCWCWFVSVCVGLCWFVSGCVGLCLFESVFVCRVG